MEKSGSLPFTDILAKKIGKPKFKKTKLTIYQLPKPILPLPEGQQRRSHCHRRDASS